MVHPKYLKEKVESLQPMEITNLVAFRESKFIEIISALSKLILIPIKAQNKIHSTNSTLLSSA
jgi:hypothetical protein